MTRRFWRSRPTASEAIYSATQTQYLQQDFRNRVIPYRGGRDKYRLSTEGVPSHVVAQCLAVERRGAEAFVETVACRLLTEHVVWIRVDFEPARRESLPFQVILVDGVQQTRSGEVVRHLPSGTDLPERHRSSRQQEQIEVFDAARMVKVTLPTKYPKKLLERVFFGLAETGMYNMPAWAFERTTGRRRNVPRFDPAKALKIERQRVLQAGLPVGWAAREMSYIEGGGISNYYYYHRELRFLHFIASMRNMAENALRQVMSIASESCRFSCTITATGIYTPDEVDCIIRQFENGELAFSSVSDIIFERYVDRGSTPRTLA